METGETILALDIGGTKMLAALVDGRDVRATQVLATPQTGDPAGWLAALFAAIGEWRGRYTAVGVAVTGIVDDGCWSALNRRTLDIPDRFPLVETVAALAGTDRVSAANDAQAAAWGESRFGAGQGGDLVFLTISTGIGGGIVLNGRLLGGLAGHFGQFRTAGADGTLEDGVSGRFIADAAQTHLPGASARDVFSAANEGRTGRSGSSRPRRGAPPRFCATFTWRSIRPASSSAAASGLRLAISTGSAPCFRPCPRA